MPTIYTIGSGVGYPNGILPILTNHQPSSTMIDISSKLGAPLKLTSSPKQGHSSNSSTSKRSAVNQPVSFNSRYKTQRCHSYTETGQCNYKEKCQFAHGDAELRQVPRHPKRKTELCKNFHTYGLCNYGERCDFIHNEPLPMQTSTPVSSKKNPRSTNASPIMWQSIPGRRSVPTPVAPLSIPEVMGIRTTPFRYYANNLGSVCSNSCASSGMDSDSPPPPSSSGDPSPGSYSPDVMAANGHHMDHYSSYCSPPQPQSPPAMVAVQPIPSQQQQLPMTMTTSNNVFKYTNQENAYWPNKSDSIPMFTSPLNPQPDLDQLLVNLRQLGIYRLDSLSSPETMNTAMDDPFATDAVFDDSFSKFGSPPITTTNNTVRRLPMFMDLTKSDSSNHTDDGIGGMNSWVSDEACRKCVF